MLLGTAPGRYWVLYVALIAESSGGVLYSPAAQARTPAIVGTGTLLSSANSLNAFSDGATRLIGGPLGGVLLTVYGIRWLICTDALSYLLSAAAMFMTSRSGGERAGLMTTIGGVARDLIDGIHVLRHQPVTRALLPVTVIFVAANTALSAVLIPLGVQRLGGTEHTGLLLSCLGAGYLIGAPVLRAALDRARPRNLLTASLAATAAAFFLLFSSSSLTTALPAAVGIGLFGSMCQVIPVTAMQRVVPNAVLGRVSAVFLTAEAAATLTGAVAGPFLAQAVHFNGIGTVAGLVTLSAAALAFLTVPRAPEPLAVARRCPGVQISSFVRWLLQKPGTTELAPFWKLLPQVGGHEQRLRGLTDGELTAAARAAGDDAEICACGREAARRALGERPYDVQVLGTLAMLSGLVAEMATGEGKTLSGALAAAGHALHGRSVHVMSVNDYLARRDAEWMAPVYDLLGVTVGWIGQASTAAERRRAYAAQVTYAPVSEFGFDVLRDRLVTGTAGLVAGDPDVALIDEADSVLIDEARVPLVLAGAAETADADREMARIAAGLRPRQHYEIDEDGRNVSLTSAGASAAEQALGSIDLYTAEHAEELTRLNVALHAHALLQRDVDYIVRDGAVHLIDESRGRVARRQRWPDGLHAAVEAKEGLSASESGEILDTITIQSLVRRYRTVCGMTGTAVAAGEQFREFYGLEIAVISPNRPCVRADEPDRLYPTVKEKEKAVAAQVAAAHATGRPVLIGTLDVAESERLAGELGRAGLRCTVLNARNDAQEAAIVAEAGAYGAITVSTQMAGRGTDIRLGGASGDRDLVAGLGGLYVIGTGRRASSRLDHQLRGRAGRQGDPGGSVFFASMEDELVLQYAPDEARSQVPDSRAPLVLGHAQRVAEGVNLEIHRNTWQYNKLVEDQRRIVLGHRERVLRADDALSALARRCPERLAELSPRVDRSVLVSAARQIVLFHLDRAWAEHLAFLADLREGIHLRALARGTAPLNEFNREAIRAFGPLLEEAEARSAETFLTAPITADGVDLGAVGLKRPTATWTYLVHENPFGTDIDRALQSVARRLRKRGD